MYYNYFRENFGYSFGRPQTDVCLECTHLQTKIKVERNPSAKKSLETKLLVHKKKATMFYTKMKLYRALAENAENTDMLCFDFKQNVPFPYVPTSDVFYSRQLWLFVFRIHSAKMRKGKMYS